MCIYEYKLVHSRSRGYAMFKCEHGVWQQVTKWYTSYKNLKRFTLYGSMPCLYSITD